jgi:hypothetical protein
MKPITTVKTASLFALVALTALIALTLACGYSAKMTPATAGNMPAIAQLNPNAATAGGAAFMLTVSGSNFNSNAVVNWNNAAQTTTYVNGKRLTVAIPAAAIANSGNVQVTVTNPGTSGGLYGGTQAETSSPMTFTIN